MIVLADRFACGLVGLLIQDLDLDVPPTARSTFRPAVAAVYLNGNATFAAEQVDNIVSVVPCGVERVAVELVALQHEGDGVDVAVVTRDDKVTVGLGHEIELGHR